MVSTERRDALKNRVKESEYGQVIDEFAGDIVVLPVLAFDDDELPDVDTRPCLVDDGGETRVPVPHHLPQSWRGGVHVVSPHHLALIWTEMKAELLRKEVTYREENDRPIPAIAERRLEREVYR